MRRKKYADINLKVIITEEKRLVYLLSMDKITCVIICTPFNQIEASQDIVLTDRCLVFLQWFVDMHILSYLLEPSR